MDPTIAAQVIDPDNGLEGQTVRSLWLESGQAKALTERGLFALAPDGSWTAPVVLAGEKYFRRAGPWRQGHLVAYARGVDYVTQLATVGLVRGTQDALYVAPSNLHPDRFYFSDVLTFFAVTAAADRPVDVRRVGTLPDLIDSLLETGDDQLLIGTESRGLWRLALTSGKFEHLKLPPARYPAKGQTRLRQLGRHTLVFTSSALYDATDGETGTRLLLDGFPANGEILAVSEANGQGEFWMILEGRGKAETSSRFLACLTIGSDEAVNMVVRDSAAVAFPTLITTVASQVVGNDRRIWIGGSGGVVTDLIVAGASPRRPARPLLVSVDSKAGPVSLAESSIRLPYEASDLTFNFAVADYSFQNTLELQSRLVGYEDEWGVPVGLGQRSIAHLPPGPYELQLRSVSPAGVVGPTAAWAFVILPPWYRTPLALAGFGVAAVALLASAYQLRTRSIRRRNAMLEELVRQRTVELEKANSAKTVFVASMSHEIRNPIHGILGLAYSLEGTPLNHLQRQYVGHIRQCANFLTSLVRDVLDFAKIEREEVSLEQGLFEPLTLIETTVAMCEGKALQAGMTIHTELDKQVPRHLIGDSARIQQVLLNYLANAVKYAATGEIVLRAQLAGASDGRVVVRFAVSDTGPGIAAAEQRRLFSKFTRGASAQKSSIHGTGLGLAISGKIAQRMGGRVGVNSAPGEGAEFWLEVPLQPAEPAAVLKPLAAETQPGRARILVADDETYNTLALAGMLHRLGYATETASDGPAALERLLAAEFDAAFLDWELPGCSGIEVAREFRARRPQARTHLVAITAYNTEQNREACLTSGMNAFLAKPVHLRQLADALAPVVAQLQVSAVASDLPPAAGTATVSLRLLNYACQAKGESLPRALDDFAARVERDLAALHLALEHGEAESAQKMAHTLAGHGAFVGADSFNQCAQRVQEHARAAEFHEAIELVRSMAAEWQRIKDTLESHLASGAHA